MARDVPLKLGTAGLREALARGVEVTYRGHSLRGDLFVCRAEGEEAGTSYYALGKRFRCNSDRKADYLAEEIMRAQLAPPTTPPR